MTDINTPETCVECDIQMGYHDLRWKEKLGGVCLECGYKNGLEGLDKNDIARLNDLMNWLRMTPEQRRAFDRNLGS
jgi:hypothetical protein